MSRQVEIGAAVQDLVLLDMRVTDKAAAIREAAAALVAAGCVLPGFEESMLKREAVSNTFLGHGVAIPHGTVEERGLIRHDGIAILQVRDGLEWNRGQVVRLVVAIAAQSDAHIGILRRLTRLMQDEARLERLATTDDPEEIRAALSDAPAAPAAAAVSVGDYAQSFDWELDYPSGLHARPATEWAETARRFTSRIRVRAGDEVADARNMIALLQLGIRPGTLLTVSAEGPDAADALATLKVTVAGLSAREKADAARAAAARSAAATANRWTPPAGTLEIAGVGASPGLAIGPVHRLASGPAEVPDVPVPLEQAADLLHDALDRTKLQLKALADDTGRRLGESDAAIFRAQAGLLADSDLITLASQRLVEGHGVAWSWHGAVAEMAGRLSGLGNAVLAARAADLRDVGSRVLANIDPALAKPTPADVPQGAILVAEDLSPSDTAGLDATRVAGLVTAQGGPTSHTAILARTLGLPAIVGAGPAALELAEGTPAIVDGQTGRLYPQPSEAAILSARDWIAAEEAVRARDAEARALPARTRDGHDIAIGANINLAEQAAFALSQGAEGVGLMRTEFLFLERGDTPGEEDQYRAYRAMADAMGDRPLIIRALDIGGDKQVAHLDLPQEENPFLGVRGARLLLRRPDLMVPQLRAIYRAAKEGGDISIMFPMITSRAEILALRDTCDRIRAELDAPKLPVGIMIEVPAAAAQARSLAAHCDFFSIGTNDLTQYTLAIDRQNPVLAAEADSLHPAVLRLIAMTVEGARAHGRWVGVCGGLAGDPFGAALLAGLGVDELSMTPRDIPAVKARLRGAGIAELREIALKALDCAEAAEVRALEAGLAAPAAAPAAAVAEPVAEKDRALPEWGAA